MDFAAALQFSCRHSKRCGNDEDEAFGVITVWQYGNFTKKSLFGTSVTNSLKPNFQDILATKFYIVIIVSHGDFKLFRVFP